MIKLCFSGNANKKSGWKPSGFFVIQPINNDKAGKSDRTASCPLASSRLHRRRPHRDKRKDIGSEYASAFRITEKNDRTVRPRYESHVLKTVPAIGYYKVRTVNRYNISDYNSDLSTTVY